MVFIAADGKRGNGGGGLTGLPISTRNAKGTTMKKLILAACCIGLLSGCTESPTHWIVELRELFLVLSAGAAGLNTWKQKYGSAVFMALLTIILALKYYR